MEIPSIVSTSLLAVEAGSGALCWTGFRCALPEEPGAVVPHAGICEGGRREIGVSTLIAQRSIGGRMAGRRVSNLSGLLSCLCVGICAS
jgi:hypothetical protein